MATEKKRSSTVKYEKLPLGSIRPEGWLRRELQLQADGLTGKLDEIWHDVSDNSAWLGGSGEAWERGPYYLDGLVRLAYALDDKQLIEKSDKWIASILSSQDETGNFGPKRNPDWWPKMVALKALTAYGEATDDKQIVSFMKAFYKYQYNTLDKQPLFYWASARAFEELIPLNYYFHKTTDDLCLELVAKLKENSYNWFKTYKKFRFKKPSTAYLSRGLIRFAMKTGGKKDAKKKEGTEALKPMRRGKIKRINRLPTVKKVMLTHGVNNAMAVKYPVLLNDFYPDEELIALSQHAVEGLMYYHGTAAGVFTSDEQLDGNDPSKGVELCTVVEFMNSLELLLQKTGNPYYADLLEVATFNALPATITKDYTAHQYVQQVNQISARKQKNDFFNVGEDGTVFGLAPNFGCCTANMHQGFPRFSEYLCLRRDNELGFFVYSPCRITTDIDGAKIVLTELTDYPFKNTVHLRIDSVQGSPEVLFNFRVPKYASLKIYVNNELVAEGNEGMLAVKKHVLRGDIIALAFETPLTVLTNVNKTISFRKGSLLMATKLRAKETNGGNGRYDDRYFTTRTQWRTTPELNKKLPSIIDTRERPVPEMPFDESAPPLEIDYRARYVYNWEEYKNSPSAIPKKPMVSEEFFVRTLVPYGSTRIRIAEHPNYNYKKQR